MPDEPMSTPIKRRSLRKRGVILAFGVLLLYLAVAYLLLPVLWTRYAYRHPALEDTPGITYTADGSRETPSTWLLSARRPRSFGSC